MPLRPVGVIRFLDLGVRPQGNSNQCPGLLLGSSNLVIPLVPLIPLALEGILEQQIDGGLS